MRRACMIDTETLGTKVDAVVFELGAIFFNENYETLSEFQRFLDIDQQLACGRTTDESTLKFWLDEDNFQHPRKAETDIATLEDGQIQILAVGGIRQNLLDFAMAYKFSESTEIWANGTDFDISKLEHLFRQFAVPIPWRYDSKRDLRTMRKIMKGRYIQYYKDPNVTAHHALNDCRWQIGELKAMEDMVNGNLPMIVYPTPGAG
jgi:hypothetical protein